MLQVELVYPEFDLLSSKKHAPIAYLSHVSWLLASAIQLSGELGVGHRPRLDHAMVHPVCSHYCT